MLNQSKEGTVNSVQDAQVDAQNAQINEAAKSPNLMTIPELEQSENRQEATKTVEGQIKKQKVASEVETPIDQMVPEIPKELTMQEKLRANIARYEEMTNKPQENSWQDSLPDALAGAHNIINYAQNTDLPELKLGQAEKIRSARTAQKNDKLRQLQKLQGMYQNYMTAQNKDKVKPMTAYQKAQLDNADKDRISKETIAKGKTNSSGKKKSKLDEEREKDIAARFTSLEEQVPNTMATIEEAKFIIGEIEGDRLDTGPGSKLAGDIGSFFDTKESGLKQRLDSLAEKAARAQLKANGEVRPTDADVEGMKRAMFNMGNTEDTNVEKLKAFIKQQESGLNEYNQMKAKVDKGESLEDFKLKPTYEAKKDNKTAPYGEEITRNGKKYKFNHSVGKYQLIK